ncbi:uncharacterized protein FYW61_016186 [Anableps anableps]
MAQKGVQLDRESFSCSICLDLLKDPVTLPCGHSYCMKCIENFWDEEDQKGVPSCPQCRQTFTPRPVLVKNIILAALTEQLKLTGLGASPPDQSFAGLEDVACDMCSGRKLKATKSCLMCLLSYCENHLQPHYDVAQLEKHQLVEPSKQLHENICSHHDEVMKMFCRSDQQRICYVCTVDEHKGHDVVSVAAERKEKQKDVELRRREIQQTIQDQEEDIKLLQQEVEAINASADKAVEDNEKIFSDLICLIQKRSSELKQQIRSQQESEVNGVKDLQEKLEQEISELKRKDAELEQLSHTEDHNQFLQSYPSLSAVSESKHSSSIDVRPLRYFEDVTAAVSELRDKLQDILREKWTNVSLRVTDVDVLLSEPEPKTRDDFLRYSQEITLDPNTAHKQLLLSEGNRKVTLMGRSQVYPDHPERFFVPFQILSEQSLTGRCYWEVEWGGLGGYVAVAYKDVISAESEFGNSDKSWALHCNKNKTEFLHNSISVPVASCQSARVGVYLDLGAGALSFYSVSETMTRLFKVKTPFTQPVYAGICIYFSYEMAQKGVQLDRESFSCSICLDLLKDPVTLPCGHSYCMKCIENFWDEEDQKGVPSCPQCRQTFIPRPVLVKNIMLAALTEQLKLTGLGASPPDQSFAGLEDVACDMCSGRKLKATKSCLMCLLSYCENHLQPHYDVARLKKHQLVEPSKQLHENICSRHNEVMKMFCRSDQQRICYVCTVDEHKGHDVVSVAAERKEKQKDVELRRREIQQRIQDGEKVVKLLQQEVEAINDCANKAVETNEDIFTEVMCLIQKRSSEVKQQIRSQQESEVNGVKDLQEKLEQEISELKRKDAELEQLSHTEDHNQFLQSYPSLSAVSESKHSSSINVRPLRYFEDVTAAVSELRDKLQDILREKWTNVSLRVTEVYVLLSEPEPEPKTRDDFLRYSQEINLDPNTAHKQLLLSEGNRKVTLMGRSQVYPDHPERLSVRFQILSEQSLTGRCYWEVEWGGLGGYVTVAYKDVYKSTFGYNDKSWALFCYPNNNRFLHNNIKTSIPGSNISRVGVYLDQRAGTLSFYSVSWTMTLLHRVQTTFTQPLYAGIQLCICFGDTAEIRKLK